MAAIAPAGAKAGTMYVRLLVASACRTSTSISSRTAAWLHAVGAVEARGPHGCDHAGDAVFAIGHPAFGVPDAGRAVGPSCAGKTPDQDRLGAHRLIVDAGEVEPLQKRLVQPLRKQLVLGVHRRARAADTAPARRHSCGPLRALGTCTILDSGACRPPSPRCDPFPGLVPKSIAFTGPWASRRPRNRRTQVLELFRRTRAARQSRRVVHPAFVLLVRKPRMHSQRHLAVVAPAGADGDHDRDFTVHQLLHVDVESVPLGLVVGVEEPQFLPRPFDPQAWKNGNLLAPPLHVAGVGGKLLAAGRGGNRAGSWRRTAAPRCRRPESPRRCRIRPAAAASRSDRRIPWPESPRPAAPDRPRGSAW